MIRIEIHKYAEVSNDFAKMFKEIIEYCAENILEEDMLIDLFVFRDNFSALSFERKRSTELEKFYKIKMLSPLESKTGFYSIPIYSSLDSGIPLIGAIEKRLRERYYEQIVGLGAHEIGHIKDWLKRGTYASFVTKYSPTFIRLKDFFNFYSDEDIQTIAMLVGLSTEDYLANTYALDAGYSSEILAETAYNLRKQANLQKLANEMFKLGEEKIKKIEQQMHIARQIINIANVTSFLTHKQPTDTQKKMIENLYLDFINVMPTELIRDGMLGLYRSAKESPSIFHEGEEVCDAILKCLEGMKK